MCARLQNNAGYTILELLIALLLTGIIAASGFAFYVSMHNSASVQEDISNMQHTARSSLQEIAKTLRMAGYKLPTGHAAFQVNGDSLFVYYSDTKPVDTVLYYLDQNTFLASGKPSDWQPMFLMKKVNSAAPSIFSDVVRSIDYNIIDASTVEVSIEAQTIRADDTWERDSGFRSFTSTERVSIRNLSI